MISHSTIDALLADISRSFAVTPGLLSGTVHGTFASTPHDSYYADIDLIFVFADDALQAGLARIEEYFGLLAKDHTTDQCRVLYSTQSGPMHPLRSPTDGLRVSALRSVPVTFFHVSVFPRSFYRADNARGERPSRLLLYSWQFLDPMLGLPLRDLTTVEGLAIDDVRFDGLGIRDCLAMLSTRTRNFWNWEPEINGIRSMKWRSTAFVGIEIFEMPLYAFKWCITNCARLLRGWLPVRAGLSDLEVFQQFLIPNSLHSVSRDLYSNLLRVDELRADYTDDSLAFENSLRQDWLYDSVTSILEFADRRLSHISVCDTSDYSFSMGDNVVPITLSLDSKDTLKRAVAELTPDRILLVADRDLALLYDPCDLLSGELLDHFSQDLTFAMAPKDKCLKGLEVLVHEAERRRLTSLSAILAFGGGSVGNTAGTAAGLICRGTRLIHVPTTLVAQLDSAIGAKQSVNGMYGKNYLGLFHAPAMILLQPLFLLSLEYRQVVDGLIEALKHGLCQDDKLVQLVLEYAARSDERPFDLLFSILRRTIELKLEYLREDPTESDPLTHLELGHKIGHAVEFLSEGQMSHGQAVAFGMLAEATLFERLGRSSARSADYLRSSVTQLIIRSDFVESLDPRRVAGQLWHDNKRTGLLLPFSYLVEPQQPNSCVCAMDAPFMAQISTSIREAKETLGCKM